jgi:vacuolar-type H+-ATPase subunit C/Vma6
MSDFDYANARLRAMQSRLLTRHTLETLTEAGTIAGFITALTNTPYREAVQTALIRFTGMECVNEALRHHLLSTLGAARRFFTDADSAAWARLSLRRYDVDNVKAILRGLSRQLPADEVLANTLPIGELQPAELAELARTADVRGAIDLLVTWRVPLARPLLDLHRTRPGQAVDVAEMELALERWHLDTALEMAQTGGGALLQALKSQADVMNILTVLRIVGTPGTAGQSGSLFVGPGHVPVALLQQAALQGSVADAIGAFANTPYGATLNNALPHFDATSRLSVFERALARQELQHLARLSLSDPLGIGVLLSYAALKTNEIANLRVIAHGVWLEEKPSAIREQLILVGEI